MVNHINQARYIVDLAGDAPEPSTVHRGPAGPACDTATMKLTMQFSLSAIKLNLQLKQPVDLAEPR
jgi:hypothetical protein